MSARITGLPHAPLVPPGAVLTEVSWRITWGTTPEEKKANALGAFSTKDAALVAAASLQTFPLYIEYVWELEALNLVSHRFTVQLSTYEERDDVVDELKTYRSLA